MKKFVKILVGALVLWVLNVAMPDKRNKILPDSSGSSVIVFQDHVSHKRSGITFE